MSHSEITLITPTYRFDLERFAFQRESIERCGIELPHLVVVHTEDVELFRKIPFRRNMTIVTSEDVLGRAIDRRRRVWKISRRDYRYWITPRGIHGWLTQQLVKLAAARFVKTDAYVCLDSDAFCVDLVTTGDFFAEDGRVHLYETADDVDVEMAEWYAHSLRFLGVKETGVPLRRFTHSPVPLNREVVIDLQKHIERMHGMDWMEAIVRGDRITEYTTYGTYARHIDGLRRVCPVVPGLSCYFWWKEQTGSMQDQMAARVRATGAKMVLVHSNMGLKVEEYRQAAEGIWAGERAMEKAAF